MVLKSWQWFVASMSISNTEKDNVYEENYWPQDTREWRKAQAEGQIYKDIGKITVIVTITVGGIEAYRAILKNKLTNRRISGNR